MKTLVWALFASLNVLSAHAALTPPLPMPKPLTVGALLSIQSLDKLPSVSLGQATIARQFTPPTLQLSAGSARFVDGKCEFGARLSVAVSQTAYVRSVVWQADGDIERKLPPFTIGKTSPINVDGMVRLSPGTSRVNVTIDVSGAAALSTSVPVNLTGACALVPIAGDFALTSSNMGPVVAHAQPVAKLVDAPTIDAPQTAVILSSGRKCAFNIRYEWTPRTLQQAQRSLTRIYTGAVLVAQHTVSNSTQGVMRSVSSQAYLSPGLNEVKLVLNAGGGAESTTYLRINVLSTCAAR